MTTDYESGHLPYNPITDRYETGGDEIELADEGEYAEEPEDGPAYYDRDRDERDYEPVLPDLSPLDPAEMLGERISVEHVGLPSPDHHAVAAHTAATLNTRLELGRILVGHRNRDDDTAGAIDAILAVFAAEPDRPAYSPWLTLSAWQIEQLLTDPANDVTVQVRDGKDELTPRDVDAIVECDDEQHDKWEVECIVLVSDAWSEPNHCPGDYDLPARVSAVTR